MGKAKDKLNKLKEKVREKVVKPIEQDVKKTTVKLNLHTQREKATVALSSIAQSLESVNALPIEQYKETLSSVKKQFDDLKISGEQQALATQIEQQFLQIGTTLSALEQHKTYLVSLNTEALAKSAEIRKVADEETGNVDERTAKGDACCTAIQALEANAKDIRTAAEAHSKTCAEDLTTLQTKFNELQTAVAEANKKSDEEYKKKEELKKHAEEARVTPTAVSSEQDYTQRLAAVNDHWMKVAQLQQQEMQKMQQQMQLLQQQMANTQIQQGTKNDALSTDAQKPSNK